MTSNTLWRCTKCLRITVVWHPCCANCGRRLALVPAAPGASLAIASTRPFDTAGESNPDPLPTRIATVDALFKGGLPRGRVVVLYGPPSAGKSRFCTQLAHAASSCLWLSAEERHEDLVHRAREMLLPMGPSTHRITDTTDTDTALEALRVYRPALGIVDSWQTFTSLNPRLRTNAAQLRFLLAGLIATAREFHIAVVLVCQIDNEGRPAVHMRELHKTHGVLHLRRVGGDDSVERVLAIKKTRFCRDGRVQLVMGDQGLAGVDVVEPEPAPPPRRRGRKHLALV